MTSGPIRIGLTTTLLAVLVTLALGCTGAPDRRADSERLKAAIAGMPGVTDASVNYENAIGRGASLNITVSMPTATRQQMVDVIDRINTVRGTLFDGYYQTVAFQPAGSSTQHFEVRCGAALDAATIADEALALRLLSARIRAGSADWFCDPGNRRLTISENTTAIGEILDAVHAADADTPTTSLEIMAADSAPAMAPFRIVNIRNPFSSDDWAGFQNLVTRLAITPWAAGVGPGSAVNHVSFGVRSPATAYQQLTAVIAAVGAGKEHPLLLAWGLDNPPPRTAGAPTFSGSVIVGACNYGSPPSEGELHPEKYLTAEALDLQRRLRTEYDTCPR